MKPIQKNFVILGIFLFAGTISGCKKLVEVQPPPTTIAGANVYTSDATAAAVLTGVYAKMGSGGSYSAGTLFSLSLFLALSSDELTLWQNVTTDPALSYYKNSLSAALAGTEYWDAFYPYIFACNSALEGLKGANNLTAAIKKQLTGEATFMRAFFYFYLTNLYGDVPLALTSDYTSNGTLSRAPQKMVYRQIIADLTASLSMLSDSYLDATLQKTTEERLRPTVWAARALLARVYLYTGAYDSAEVQATAVINNRALFNLVPPDSVFLKNSSEAIWQIQPTMGKNTPDGATFILPATGPTSGLNPVYLSRDQLDVFEAGDTRKSKWVNSITTGGTTYYYPSKYKENGSNPAGTEYEMIFRLAELYLIRAEARDQLGNLPGALNDLNMIRSRAGVPPSTASTPSAVLMAIVHERQTELFTESGQRWLDLKRTGYVDSVMRPATIKKGGTWNIHQQWYPISLGDISRDKWLVQNPGY